jgi:hypothetical protein
MGLDDSSGTAHGREDPLWREMTSKGAAPTFGARNFEPAAVPLQHVLDDREAQA